MGYFSNAIKGIWWMGSLQGAFRLLTLLKFIIIARILSPSEIGLFGIVMLMVSFFESISDFGLSLFLIQTEKQENKLINAVWTVSIVRGVMLSILLVLVSYPIAMFFNVTNNIYLFLIASIIPLIKSFVNPSIAKFQKHLLFHKEFIFRSTIITIEVLSSIIFVFLLRSPVGLIYSLLLSTLFETILSLIIIKPVPKLIFEIKEMGDIVHFGKWVSVIGATSFFANQLDSIFVGKILGVESLGIYQIAQKFSLRIMSEAGDVVAKVVFPIFAKIKNDHARLKKAFFKTLLLLILFFGILALGLLLYSSEFILLSVGSQWLIAQEPLKIFAVLGLVTVAMSIMSSLFLALARQDITAKLVAFRLIVLAIVLFTQEEKLNVITVSLLSLTSFAIMFLFAFYYLISLFRKRTW